MQVLDREAYQLSMLEKLVWIWWAFRCRSFNI